MIPDQLTSDVPAFIRLAKQSKAPQRGNSASDGPFFHASDTKLVAHLGNGGNVGRVLRDDLVAFDVDGQRLGEFLEEQLGQTFAIESGGDGFGYHYYYRCPEWEGNQSEITTDRKNIGSLRSGNSYCLVPPSVHDETRDEYQIATDRPIRAVSESDLDSVLSHFDSGGSKSANTGGGGGRAAGRPAGVGSLPAEYPNRKAEWATLRKWLESNGLLGRLSQTSSADWSGDEFAVAKCLAEGGFHRESIRAAMDRFSHRSKWHRRGEDYQSLTIQKAIESACDDPYVEFSHTGDMGADASESRKTESGDTSPGQPGGDNMSSNSFDYTSKESLTVYQADSPQDAEDGDRVVRVELTNMAGRGEDGEDVDTDFVSIRKGQLRDDGEFGVSPDLPAPNQSKSVGAADPDDLRLIAEGLEEMADRIED